MKRRGIPVGVDADHAMYFMWLFIFVFIPVVWIASIVMVVGSHGELGCVLSDRCDDPWTVATRVRFFVLLLGPPAIIWLAKALIQGLIRRFSRLD